MVKYTGRLSLFYKQWSLLTNNPLILSCISGYEIPFSIPINQTSPPIEKSYSQKEKLLFYEAIDNLLSIGAVSKCEPIEGQFLSNVFLVPKPNGKYRFILNLKNLNQFINTDHFKMEDLRTVLKLITKDCFMTKIDLKDAYYLIKVHENSKKYLRFKFDNNLFEFNVLPFGLSTAPYIFTKVLKPIVRLLRSAGLTSTNYLDDFWLMGQTYEECLYNTSMTSKLLISLGFLINEEKSCMIPSKICTFLGFVLDSEKFQITLPSDKINRVKTEIHKLLNLNRCKIRDFARFVGLLVSICPAVEYSWLYTKFFERCKYLNLESNNNNYDKFMTLPLTLQPDLRWWCNAIQRPFSRIKEDTFDLEIFSDASNTGWGAACGRDKASGLWSVQERTRHINYLEIHAAFFGLKVFAKDLINCQILLRVDNTTAISYINRMGGIQFPHLTEITRQIWQWCETRRLYIVASYIKSSENQTADAESRRIHPDIEWELADWAYQEIVDAFRPPEVDLFASRINKKCSRYVSWHRDPDAMAVNAFTISWADFYFYAFPPFSVILKTLRKIVSDSATGIVVVPLWPTQPWYPLFKSLLISKSFITFKANTNPIVSFHSSHRSIHRKVTLVAGILCGRRG